MGTEATRRGRPPTWSPRVVPLLLDRLARGEASSVEGGRSVTTPVVSMTPEHIEHRVRTGDGRVVAVAEWGDPKG